MIYYLFSRERAIGYFPFPMVRGRLNAMSEEDEVISQSMSI